MPPRNLRHGNGKGNGYHLGKGDDVKGPMNRCFKKFGPNHINARDTQH